MHKQIDLQLRAGSELQINKECNVASPIYNYGILNKPFKVTDY